MRRLWLFAALIAWSGMSSAVVYKWVDGQGKLQYGDRPPDGVHAEVVEMLGHTARPGAAATPARAAPSPPPPAVRNPAPVANDADDTTKRQVADDVAQTREKQCTEAQEHYKKLIEGRKMYKTGPNGEREYLTSEEIDSERLNAKRDIDTICNSAS